MRHSCCPQRSFPISSNAHNGSVGSTGFHSHITTAACHAKTRQFRQAKVRKCRHSTYYILSKKDKKLQLFQKLSYMYSSSIIGSNRNFNSPQHKLPWFGTSTACTSSPSSAIKDMVEANVIWGDNLSSYKKIPSLLTIISLICHIFGDVLKKRKLYEACEEIT